MSDLNSIEIQIQALIALANQITGRSDTNLTDCVNALIAGYGGESVTTFSITNNMTNCKTSNNATTITEGSSYSATITANTDYQLSTVKVTMGGTDVTSSTYSSGKITINSVTGNIVVTATATAIPTYTITNNLTGCVTSNSASSIKKGYSYTTTITVNDGYELSSVKVTMGGTDVTSTAYSNGAISISSVTGNIVITATATEIETAPYTNLFDATADGYELSSETKFYTNWMPYNYLDNDGKGTIYHLKGLTNTSTNPYKFQFKNKGTGTSALIYCTNANVQPKISASYDSSVVIIQHNTGSADYSFVRFEIREAVPSNLIITANEDIIDE